MASLTTPAASCGSPLRSAGSSSCSQRYCPGTRSTWCFRRTRVIHIFAGTATQWDFTTLAPILELAAGLAALLVAGLVPRPAANVTSHSSAWRSSFTALCAAFVVPSLGVELLPGGVPAVTQLEGGPFIELLGGGILLLGALGDLLTLPAGQEGGPRLSRGWRVGRSVPPARAG
jgi:hypothetical protein